jgi:beta-fructofuranosidase
VQYFVGKLDPKTLRFTAEKRGVMDFGSYYAPNCMVDAEGRRVLWGWVQDFPKVKGWNGCMTLPRRLHLDEDHVLRQRPIGGLEKLRGEGRSNHVLGITDEKVIENVKGAALEIVAGLVRGAADEVGLKLRRSADGEKAITISFDGKKLRVAGLDVPVTLRPHDTLGLHVFLDHSVLEVYASDARICVTRVIDAVPGDQGVSVFARGGKAECKWLDTWQMNSIWETTKR